MVLALVVSMVLGMADVAAAAWTAEDAVVSDTETVYNTGSGFANCVPVSPLPGEWDLPAIQPLEDKGAVWIWPVQPVAHPVAGDRYELTRTFEIPGQPEGASLRITADNGYEVWINDVWVGSAQVGDGWWTTTDPLTESYVNGSGWQSIETYPIDASLLEIGANTLRIRVANEQMDGGTTGSNPAGVIFVLDYGYQPYGSLVVQKVFALPLILKTLGAGDPPSPANIEFSLYGSYEGGELSNHIADATTDAGGLALFENLEPGDYWLTERYWPEGYYPLIDPMPVTIVPGETTPVDFANAPLGSITIHKDWVPYGGSEGDEQPHEGVTFKLYFAPFELSLNEVKTAVFEPVWTYLTEGETDGDGILVFDGLLPGLYKVVEVVPPGYHKLFPESDPVEDLTPGEHSGFLFVNEKDDETHGKLTINVVKSDGGNVENLPVAVSGDLSATIHTNASGKAVLTGLYAGTYTVNASDSGYESNGPKDAVLPADSSEESVTITLTPTVLPPSPPEPGAIAGNVTEEGTGNPLPGATVELLDSEGGLEGTTSAGALGYYEFDNLAPGSYKVRGSMTGYESDLNSPVEVLAGETTHSNLVLGKEEIVVPPIPPEEPPVLPVTGDAFTVLYLGFGAALIGLGAIKRRR